MRSDYLKGTYFGKFGEFRQNSPKLVPAKIEYFAYAPKKILAKIKFLGILLKQLLKFTKIAQNKAK